MRYSLRQIQVFLAVVKLGSVSKAAGKLALTQSAVSTALIDLENKYDLQLFDRVGKRLVLNDIGKALVPVAEALMSQAEGLETLLSTKGDVTASAQTTVLAVGATVTIGNYLLMPELNKLLQVKQKLVIEPHIFNTQRVVDEIHQFNLDFGLIEGEVVEPDFHVLPWKSDRMCIFCRPNNPILESQTDRGIPLSVLSERNWTVREVGSGTRQAFERFAEDARIYPQHVAAIEQPEAIKSAVATSGSLGFLSEHAVKRELESGELVELKVDSRMLERQCYLIFHRQKYLSPILREVVQFLGVELPGSKSAF